MTLIGVTGSTGRLGTQVAYGLHAQGRRQRLLVRDVDRSPQLPGSEVVSASYDDGPTAEQAMAGLETVLMISAPEDPGRVQRHCTFIDAAAHAGVRHLVYTSFVGAAEDAEFTLARDHGGTEEYIRASGMDFTFLRDNLYADAFPGMVAPGGVLRGPAGDGRVAAVARRDIGEAAVAVLMDPETHRNRTYELTGPQALTLDEVAAVMSDAQGEDVRYERETVRAAYASRKWYGAPQWELDAWVSTYTAIASGAMARVTSDIELITGLPATTLYEVVRAEG